MTNKALNGQLRISFAKVAELICPELSGQRFCG